MIKAGITGGIGTGKSTVTRIFQLLGIPVYDADTRAKWLMANDSLLVNTIKKQFGEKAYKDGKPDNEYLASVVFNNPENVKLLNHLVHPRVGDDFKNWSDAHSQHPYVLKEAALLIEAGSYKDLDKLIVVSSPLELRIQRILKRDAHRDRQQIENIISLQLPEAEKLNKADYVIQNDEKNLLIEQVLKIHSELIASSR